MSKSPKRYIESLERQNKNLLRIAESRQNEIERLYDMLGYHSKEACERLELIGGTTTPYKCGVRCASKEDRA